MVDQHLNVNKFLLFLMTFFAQIENAVLKAEHFCKIFTQNNFFYTIRNQPDQFSKLTTVNYSFFQHQHQGSNRSSENNISIAYFFLSF